eukprot:scaffold1860_cov403-Prasinococcus_capsulatus_cf.AAC.13
MRSSSARRLARGQAASSPTVPGRTSRAALSIQEAERSSHRPSVRPTRLAPAAHVVCAAADESPFAVPAHRMRGRPLKRRAVVVRGVSRVRGLACAARHWQRRAAQQATLRRYRQREREAAPAPPRRRDWHARVASVGYSCTDWAAVRTTADRTNGRR